jgi:hypothetical protein
MPKHLEIYKVIDKADSYYTKKDLIFDLPLRIGIIGASQRSGKSSVIVNLVCRDEFYNKDFKGENIYIISPSIENDLKLKKMIEVKDIPDHNLFTEYDEGLLEELYNMLAEDYKNSVDSREKPTNKLIIMDDLSYSGALKNKTHGIISKLFCNGRHILVSTLLTSQKYSDLLTTCRENLNGAVLFSCSNKQLDLIEQDHNFLKNKKDFNNMFRDATKEKHSFFVVNYTNGEDLYQDSNFNFIKK